MLIIEDAEIEAGSSGVVLNERLREWVTDNVIDLVGLFDMRESFQSDVGDASDARSSDGQSTALGLSGNGGGHDATRTVDNGAGDPETVQTRWILLICLLKLHLVLQKERRFEPVVREQTKLVTASNWKGWSLALDCANCTHKNVKFRAVQGSPPA